MKKSLILLAVGLIAISATALSQGKFSGYMFGDYYYTVARDSSFNHTAPSNAASGSAAPGTKAMQAFQLRRVYFTYDNDISEQFATRFRLEADQAANASNGKIGVFVKDAYLKWKNVFSGSDLIFGIQPPPAYEISEAAWGYRSLEKTIMDLRGIVSSRDQGISLHGKLVGDGMVNYWVMVANNSGNSPETDKYKRYYAHIHVKPSANLQATVYADLADRADFNDAYHSGSTLRNSAITTALFVGYSEPFAYNLGVEAFLQSTSNALKDTSSKSYTSRSALGISIFGSYNLMPELAVMARYDNYNPSTDSKGKDPVKVTSGVAINNLARNYIIAGLSYKADKNVYIIPNIVYETYEAPKSRTAPYPSVTARLTLHYIFL
jgi:hypothetical protein